ncbi:DivIVA domain-containing protein [Arthrobacter sp. ISL-28]|uniref:DivIVA domain-containing protein n=1 Tax=Arthrobacter sp. ISL-28 TaxID=2819108 RepID=UPI00288B19FA|nr:DivIVA domain-containing protein [Arthrobacter sp. ISL-28]
MSLFLVFLAIVLIGVTAVIGTDLGAGIFRKGRPGGQLIDDGFDEPVASLPPVLLPADPKPADVDHVRFALGLRGYRMDQVDQVLDELRDQLAAKDSEIERLRSQLRSRGPRTAPEARDTSGDQPGTEDQPVPEDQPRTEDQPVTEERRETGDDGVAENRRVAEERS